MHPCIHVSQAWEEVWPRVNEGPFVIKRNGLYYMPSVSYTHLFFDVPWINDLKIRGNWGRLGNSSIGDWDYIGTINPVSYTHLDVYKRQA